MENVMTLKAESRHEVGKKIAKKLRKEGRVPAIIYGENTESIPISLAVNDIKAILKSKSGENTVLKIHRGDSQVDAMLKDVQFDYLSDNIIHADLIRIDLNKPVVVNVPILISGDPIGVKVEGGFFEFITREIKIKCLPTKIPKEFKLDVSDLHVEHSIKASDIKAEEGIRIISDSHTVICAVTTRAGEETIAEAVTEEAAAEGEKPEEAASKDKEKDKDKDKVKAKAKE